MTVVKEVPASPIATEDNRFNSVMMGTNLTIECARKFKKKLLETGGDRVEDDIKSGRATKDFTPEEIEAMLKK